MIGPIPHQKEKKVYPQTFLVEVIWQLRYTMDPIDENYQAFHDYIKTHFNNDLSREAFQAMGILPIRYDKNSGEAKVKFSNNFAEFKLTARQYYTFEASVRPMLEGFIELLRRCKANLWHISCDKKNLIAIALPQENQEQNVLNMLIAPEPLQYPSNLIQAADFNKDSIPSIHHFRIKDNNLTLQALYGVYRHEGEQNKESDIKEYGIMVESKCDSSLVTASYADTLHIADAINDTLYDFLHWFFVKDVIEVMESEPEK